jgi:hypothetical protein
VGPPCGSLAIDGCAAMMGAGLGLKFICRPEAADDSGTGVAHGGDDG